MNREHLQSVPYAEAGIQETLEIVASAAEEAAIRGLYFAAQNQASPATVIRSTPEQRKIAKDTEKEINRRRLRDGTQGSA